MMAESILNIIIFLFHGVVTWLIAIEIFGASLLDIILVSFVVSAVFRLIMG